MIEEQPKICEWIPLEEKNIRERRTCIVIICK